MNGYELSRNFIDFSFENPSKIKPNHYAMYFFSIEHCNRLGWKKEFGLPTTVTMEAIGIKSYNTYINTFNDLIDFGFYNIIQRSKNQHSSNIIELSKNDKATDKALDKAFIKHNLKHSESTVSIDKQINKETIKLINNNPDLLNTNLKVWISESKELVLDNEDKKVREEQFELFWNKYPKKTNKKDSKIKFLKLKEDEVIKILSTIDDFIRYKPFETYNHPNPTTYINQKRWDDELKPVKVTPKYHI